VLVFKNFTNETSVIWEIVVVGVVGVVVLGDDPPAASASSMGMGMGMSSLSKSKSMGVECIGWLVFFVFVFEIDNRPIHRISCSLKSKIVSDQYDRVVWRGGANKAVHPFLLLNKVFQIGIKSTAFAQPLEYNVEQVVCDMSCDDFCCP
jgi:hypothetical protein